jgi:hypothetical protein
VKAETDRLLVGWSSFHGMEAQGAATTKLGELAERRSQLELALAEVGDALQAVEGTNVDAEVVRAAFGQIREVYDHLKPFEQELVRLVLQRAEVSEHRLVLEIKTSACATLAQAPNIADLAGIRFPLPERLPESVTQSVVLYEFPVRLRGLRVHSRLQSERRAAGVGARRCPGLPTSLVTW